MGSTLYIDVIFVIKYGVYWKHGQSRKERKVREEEGGTEERKENRERIYLPFEVFFFSTRFTFKNRYPQHGSRCAFSLCKKSVL